MMKKKKNKKTSSSLLERDDDCVLFSSLGSLCRQKLASFQDKLSCPICKEFFTLPVTLVRCGHTFCGKCLNDYVRTFQDDKKRKCPRCKGPVTHESDWDNTGEVAVKPNELVEEIVVIIIIIIIIIIIGYQIQFHLLPNTTFYLARSKQKKQGKRQSYETTSRRNTGSTERRYGRKRTTS